jgi:hypothetical protein
MILCSAFPFALFVGTNVTGFSGFAFELVRADYGKMSKRSNRNHKKMAAAFHRPLKYCIRRPALASSCGAGQPGLPRPP